MSTLPEVHSSADAWKTFGLSSRPQPFTLHTRFRPLRHLAALIAAVAVIISTGAFASPLLAANGPPRPPAPKPHPLPKPAVPKPVVVKPPPKPHVPKPTALPKPPAETGRAPACFHPPLPLYPSSVLLQLSPPSLLLLLSPPSSLLPFQLRLWRSFVFRLRLSLVFRLRRSFLLRQRLSLLLPLWLR